MSKIGTSLVVGIAVVATIFATISVLSLTGKINFANEGAKILHGEVVYAYGDVYKEKGGELVKIGDGEIINEGDVIKTNADSKATVLFDDGSIVRLSDNTQIEIKDIKGVTGNECLELTEYIEKELGEIMKREFAQEYEKKEFVVDCEYEKQN